VCKRGKKKGIRGKDNKNPRSGEKKKFVTCNGPTLRVMKKGKIRLGKTTRGMEPRHQSGQGKKDSYSGKTHFSLRYRSRGETALRKRRF